MKGVEEVLFNPYRYFIVPSEGQYHISHYEGKYDIDKKEMLVNDVFSKMEIQRKEKVQHSGNTYLIYFISKYDERYLLLKLGREKEREIYQEGDVDINDTTIQDYPYVYILMDKKKQIFLIQHLATVFQGTHICANILRTFLNTYATQHKYEIKINPMLIKDNFWKSISTMDSVNVVDFNLESPNLFEGWISTNSFLKEIQKRYNNTSSQFKFKNTKSSLTLKKDNKELKDAVEYISNGGGKWTLNGTKGENSIRAESEQHLQKITTNEDVQEMFRKKDKKAIIMFSEIVDIIKE